MVGRPPGVTQGRSGSVVATDYGGGVEETDPAAGDRTNVERVVVETGVLTG